MEDRVAPRALRDMMVEQGIDFASAAQIGEWIGCRPADVTHRLRGARQAREMVCVTQHGWVPAVDGRCQTAGVHGADDAPLRPSLLSGWLVSCGPSRRFTPSVAGTPFRY